jgi:GNAT superfamily N-acetyltransferase
VSQMSHRITVENGEGFPEAVLEGLMVFNHEIAGPSDLQHVGLAMRAEDGSLMAGLVGLCYWNMLRIDLLWVAPTHRRAGCGTALLQRAEQVAIERGCELVFLSTYSFQAPEFYRKHGYRAFGVLENAPAGFSTTWFSKRFA